MKKIILNLIILIGISSLITGCLSAPYQQEYISAQLKPDLKKVNKNICINETSKKEIISVEKYEIDFHVKETNKNVAINYFNQYFLNVNKQNEECFLTVDTKINNIDSKFISLDGMNAIFELTVEINKNNINLVDMTTKEDYSSETIIMLPFMVFLGGNAPYKTANEAFHKGLLDVYETKVEKLLLKALEENK
jgi:hypothetical protein